MTPFGKISLAVTVSCSLFLSNCSVSDVSAKEKGVAVGEYIAAHQAIDALKQSRCGYLVSSSLGADGAMQEVSPYLEKYELDIITSTSAASRPRVVKAVNDTLTKTLGSYDEPAGCTIVLLYILFRLDPSAPSIAYNDIPLAWLL